MGGFCVDGSLCVVGCLECGGVLVELWFLVSGLVWGEGFCLGFCCLEFWGVVLVVVCLVFKIFLFGKLLVFIKLFGLGFVCEIKVVFCNLMFF